MFYLALCDMGPEERKRIGPFANIEVYRQSNHIGVQRPNSEDWEEIDLSEYKYVFVEAEPLDIPDHPFDDEAGYDEVQPRCDICGNPQWLTGDDWNGETGNHLSCERFRAVKAEVHAQIERGAVPSIKRAKAIVDTEEAQSRAEADREDAIIRAGEAAIWPQGGPDNTEPPVEARIVDNFRRFSDAELEAILSIMPSPDPDQGQYDREENMPAIRFVQRERAENNRLSLNRD